MFDILLDMRFPSRQPILSLGVVTLLVIVLVVLAVLQYQWSGQISEAERERLRSSLNISTSQFRDEFQRELARLVSPTFFDPRTAGRWDWPQLQRRLDLIMQNTSRPELLSQVYVWETDGPLHRFDRSTREWDDTATAPAALTAWHEHITRMSHGGPPRPGFSWSFEASLPAVIRPVYHYSGETRDRRDNNGPPPIAAWVIVELNKEYIEREYLPELAQRYFSATEGRAYDVAVTDTRTHETLFHSSANLPFDHPDAIVSLAEQPMPMPPGESAGGGRRWRARDGARRNGPGGGGGGRGIGMLLAGSDGDQWQLVAKHPAGSVENAVNALRLRNLAVSFSVLLLLAASMAIILLSAQRAHRLAAMQMEFVAGVSHELRTPLAVICSAADNLADGVIADKPQVTQYGELIRGEGRRLADMVEQILRFASGQAGKAKYELKPVSVEEIVEVAAGNVQPLLQERGGLLEAYIQPGIPAILADSTAVLQCLNNLLTNAIKYGGDTPWVGLRATVSPEQKHIAIQVEDHGMGIDPAELGHIFEPFYRGEAVTAAQIHGTGLGLSLTKSMAEAMGGRLTVESTPHKGSTFTLSLPIAPLAAETLTEAAPRYS